MYKKLKDFVIYRDINFYSAFPAVANLGDGRLIAAFRRAPNYHGLPGIARDHVWHADILSQLMCIYSNDNGKTWGEPQLLYSPPQGGSQDGGLFYDHENDILYAHSFIWRYVPESVAEKLKETGQDEFIHNRSTRTVPAGTYIMRSLDKGVSWEGPFIPDPLPAARDILPGTALAIHNRGNIVKTDSGKLLLSGQALGFRPEFNSSVVVYASSDKGRTWNYYATAADCEGKSVFEEPCLYTTPSGKYVMAIRCHRDRDERFKRAMLYISESRDRGKTWTAPRNTGIHAEPSTLCQTDDGKVILAYGYRKSPFGVRMRICDPELDSIENTKEIVIRDDAGWQDNGYDTGYPWICPIGDNRFLIVYYINKRSYEGAAAIEGSIIEISC